VMQLISHSLSPLWTACNIHKYREFRQWMGAVVPSVYLFYVYYSPGFSARSMVDCVMFS
jgi:hypothetical protein